MLSLLRRLQCSPTIYRLWQINIGILVIGKIPPTCRPWLKPEASGSNRFQECYSHPFLETALETVGKNKNLKVMAVSLYRPSSAYYSSRSAIWRVSCENSPWTLTGLFSLWRISNRLMVIHRQVSCSLLPPVNRYSRPEDIFLVTSHRPVHQR